jgi:Ca2+-binding EF-hand superfamily protein
MQTTPITNTSLPTEDSNETAEVQNTSAPSEDVSNYPSNDEGQTPLTPTGTDSTGATEDLLGSNANADVPLSGQEQLGNSVPENQPPTVDDRQKTLQETISKLDDLLMQFTFLDTNGDSALDYMEFDAYTEDSEGTEHVFKALDVDGNDVITRDEISNAIHVLQKQTTEATEDIPDDSSKGDVEPPINQGEDVPGTPAEPVTNGPTQYDEGTHQSNGSVPGSDIPAVVPPATGGLDNPDSTVSNTETPVTSPGEPTSGPDTDDGTDTDEKTAEAALSVLSGILKGFDGLDLNHDQRLSSYEFTLYFPKTDAMVTSIFSSLDADGDYFVTYQEMVHAVGLLSEMAPTEEATNYYPERPNYEQSQEPEDELADYLKNHGDNANF